MNRSSHIFSFFTTLFLLVTMILIVVCYHRTQNIPKMNTTEIEYDIVRRRHGPVHSPSSIHNVPSYYIDDDVMYKQNNSGSW